MVTHVKVRPSEENNMETEKKNNEQDKRLLAYSIKKEWNIFSTEISVAGARYVFNTEANIVRKLIWATLVLFGFGFAVYQISQQISLFSSKPTSVKVDVIVKSRLPFPTVTICNENSNFSKKKVLEIDPSGNMMEALKILLPSAQETINFTRVTYALQLIDQWRTDRGNPSWNDIYKDTFLDLKNQIKQCKFNGGGCEIRDEQQFVDVMTNAGRCLQFNPRGNVSVQQSGSSVGLQLLMDTEQSDYFVSLSPVAGYKVVLHEHTEPPSVTESGFIATVGQSSNLQIQRKKYVGLPLPYGNCTDQVGYGYGACFASCYSDYMMEQCNCTPFGSSAENTVCSLEISATCFLPAHDKYYAENILASNCDCPQQCDETIYEATLTSGDFSNSYLDRTIQSSLNVTADEFKENYVSLNIYYSKLQSEEWTTIPAYSTMSLFCDIGGALGLVLGSTVLTLFEFGDFLIVTLVHAVISRRKPMSAEI